MSERLKITARGEGRELVLVHGWAMHSGIWSKLVEVLASEFRVNLVDLPGHGINRHIPLARELDALAAMILSELPPAIWMGWSLGGLVTLAAAIAQPEKVQKAILVSATPSFAEQEDWDCGVSRSAQQLFSNGLESDFEDTLDQFWLQCFGAAWSAESLRLLGKTSVGDKLPEKDVLQNGLHLLYSNNLLADSSRCNVPTLFIGGTRDRTITAESFTRAALKMPLASSHLVRAAGHAPFISHQDRFLDIFHGFLNGEQAA